MTPSLSSDDWSELRRILEDVARLEDLRGIPSQLASDAGHFLPKLAFRERAVEVRRSATRQVRGESATARHKRIAEEVRARDGRCAAVGFLGIRCQGPSELDHVHGRARAEESIETVEYLCQHHHRHKTDNIPSRLVWLERHRARAEEFGYSEEVVRTERAIAQELGQHPEHREAGRG